ncbi:MAG: glycosyltransferase family 4 protein [Pseudonocardiaceae bacterium]
MRIAYAVSSYHPRVGGVETHVQRIASGCAEAGDEVTILSHEVRGCPADERIGPVRVLRFPLTVHAANYPLSWSLLQYLRSHVADFDLVHAHSYHTLVGHAAVSSRLPFVFTPHYHGTGHTMFRKLLHQVYRPVGARPFSAADAIVCVSDAERTLVVRDFPSVADKVTTIPNGTDATVPAPDAEWAMLTGPVVLTVGRLERYKNVDLIINAFRNLSSAATLVVVGEGPDRIRLERRAAEPGWPVLFLGKISDAQLSGLFARASVVASGSDHEAFGMTIAAGLASGARVVASDIAAHAEVARLAGAQAPVTLVDPRDTTRLTEVLAAALLAGRPPAGELRLPSWADVVDATRELYSRVSSRMHVADERAPAGVSGPSVRSSTGRTATTESA